MQLALRLYYPVDADLIAIRLREKRHFTYLVREKLARLLDPGKTFSEKDLYTVSQRISKYIRYLSEPMKVNLNLKEGRDDIVITYLQQIPASVRCDTVKALFRMCLNIYPHEYFPIEKFLTSSKTMILHENVSEVNQTGKKKMGTGRILKKNNSFEKDSMSKQPVLDKNTVSPNDIIEEKSGILPDNKINVTAKPKKNITEIEQISNKEVNGKELSLPGDGMRESTSAENAVPSQQDASNDNAAYEMFFQMLGY